MATTKIIKARWQASVGARAAVKAACRTAARRIAEQTGVSEADLLVALLRDTEIHGVAPTFGDADQIARGEGVGPLTGRHRFPRAFAVVTGGLR